jgi:ABC-type uncharacterized transport system permease subunit
MRSSSLFIFSGAAMGLAGAAPVFGSVLDNILPVRGSVCTPYVDDG